MTTADDLFADADEVSESVYFAALDFARTFEEAAFRDVLVFHRDYLNGGLAQALENQFVDLGRYLAAYRSIGLNGLSDLIGLASTFVREAEGADDFKNKDIETLDSAYCAATYGLGYASNLRGDLKLADAERSLQQRGDSVERLVLRFARIHHEKFDSVIAAASH